MRQHRLLVAQLRGFLDHAGQEPRDVLVVNGAVVGVFAYCEVVGLHCVRLEASEGGRFFRDKNANGFPTDHCLFLFVQADDLYRAIRKVPSFHVPIEAIENRREAAGSRIKFLKTCWLHWMPKASAYVVTLLPQRACLEPQKGGP